MDVFMLLAILPEITTLYSPGKLGMVPGSIVDSSHPICLLSSLALSVHWFCVEELLVQRCQLQNRGISSLSKTPISVQRCNTRQALTPGNIPHASNGYEIRQPQKYQTQQCHGLWGQASIWGQATQSPWGHTAGASAVPQPLGAHRVCLR